LNLDACARSTASSAPAGDAEPEPDQPALSLAVDRDGFDMRARVRIEAGDDLGRERLCR